MHRCSLQRAGRRTKPPATTLLLALTCALIVGALWSCRLTRPTLRQGPLTYESVPIIRVLITPRPVERIVLAAAGGYRLRVDDQIVAEADGSLGETIVTRSGPTWRFGSLTADGRGAALETFPDGLARAGETSYRGSLRLLPAGGQQFLIVNHLDMESYLAGVLAKELYVYWHPETYRALAVAGRTFAMYHMLTFGESHDYDLGSTQAAQVYGGFSAETVRAWQALRSTHGQVLTFGPNGDERVFMAQYSSCCGGRVNGAGVIRNADDIQPLAGGQECGDCAAIPRHLWPPVRIAKADIHRALTASYKAAGELSDVRQLRVIDETLHGRAIWVDVVDGGNKSVRLRAEDVRLSLLRAGVPGAGSLYSMNCRFRDVGDAIEFYDGRGFGHGVGLCQWGAQTKALRGETGEKILSFYYPGAKIFRAY